MDWAKATASILEICKTTFGKTVTYTPVGHPSLSIVGIFDAHHVGVSVNSGPESSMVAPALGVKLSELPKKPGKGDQVAIDSVNYRVVDSHEDGQGGSTLILMKV